LPPHAQADLPYFYPIDTRVRYQHNLQSQPSDWIWRNRSVTYTLNSQGYRAPEFDSINWSSSILCFGCSMTFGIGVDDSETWPHYLEQIVGIPCINLSVAGGSIQLNWANSVKLQTQSVRPRAVVYYWPNVNRSCEFIEGGQRVINWGPWSQPVSDLTVPGASSSAWVLNPLYAATMAQLMISSLQWGCPCINLTWGRDLALVRHYLNVLDSARDLVHPGPFSHQRMAQLIASELGVLFHSSH
jgi:hypothetical protein